MGVLLLAKGRTRWNADERRELARYVVENCKGPLVGLYDDELVELVREGMILVLEPGRDRVIQGVSVIRWIREEILAVLHEPDEEEEEVEYPPPYVDPPREDDPGAPPDRFDDPGDPVPVGAPESQPEPSYARQTRRIQNRLNQIRAEQTRTADELASLVDLVMDALPQLKKSGGPPILPEIPKIPDCHLFIAVAGLKGDQQQSVEKKVGDLVELDFIDVAKKKPSQVGGCDLLIATRWSGRTWTRTAREIYGDAVVEAHSASEVVRMIREIVKTN
jgi:hypothetical protein